VIRVRVELERCGAVGLGVHLVSSALEDARYANWRIKIVAVESRDLAKQAGYASRDLGLPRGSPSVCVPLRTTRSDAIKIIARERQRLGFEP
jgi:hypothetical protein